MTRIRYNIRCIKPYKSDANVEYITTENMYGDSQHMITSHILLYYIKAWTKGIYLDTHGYIDVDSNTSYLMCT